VQDSFTDYLLCVLSDECVADHNEKITHKNRHTILCNSQERCCSQKFIMDLVPDWSSTNLDFENDQFDY